ncbi:MAG: hypothetical protein EXX96DRAFT_619745 [Benjaminiella poitrasii]|nr:MAG: hypothetical protein EXX96DRAFT_619745 [Benjaminiella poitrasii]
MLIDMIDVSFKGINYDNRSTAIHTVGILHPGLSCIIVELDRPTAYVFRVSRGKKIEISNKIEKFGSTILSANLSLWVCCEIVKDVLNIVRDLRFFQCLLPPCQVKQAESSKKAVRRMWYH